MLKWLVADAPGWPAAVRRAGLVVLIAAMLGGCDDDPAPGDPATTGQAPPHAPEPEPEPIVLPPEELHEQVLAHAAELTGLPVAELEVLRSLRVTWRDGSLGCPGPDMSYTMALVPGWHLILRAGEQVLDYRLSSRAFMLCAHPSDNGYAPDPGVTTER